ncbi:Metalloenzyme, LuxS/M16 peptidase-like protein, partial [Baffinella frigidus]
MKIAQPEVDKRQYRLVKLDNEMDICLVSDPETQIAAAALAVCAGQLQDPPEVQGLAHFCEHMLFLGNEKFPGESDFDSFCAQSAGYSNAWTSMDRTVYHYMLAHDRLAESLDRFSGFFSCPLFTEDLTERELNAIETPPLQDDARREFQLWRSTAKEGHPLQRFGTGNLHTLKEIPEKNGTNIREHLLRFHESSYSANIMKLSVLGREDLDTLEALVRQHFSAVPNRNLEPLAGSSADDDPFDAGWKQLYRIVPVKERRKLCLFFPMRSTYPDYRTKMTRFLSHCVGHEGKGSILSLLKKKGLATDLGAGTATQSTHFSIFEISVKLTEEGLQRYEEVISLMFVYINARVRLGSREEKTRVRSEVATIETLNFRFRSKAREDNYTEQMACNLTRYPRELVLCGPDLYFDPIDFDALDAL